MTDRDDTPKGAPPLPSDELLRRVVDSAPIVISAIDRDGVFTLTAGRGLAALRSVPGRAVGHSVFTWFPDAREIHDHVRRALAGETFAVEAELRGAWFESHYAPLRGPDGAVTGAISVSTDVTARHHAKDALRRSEARFRTLIERSPDGVVVVRDGRIAYANRAFAALVDHPDAEALVGAPVERFVHPDDVAAFASIDPDSPDALPREIRLVANGGREIVVERASLPTDFDAAPAVLVLLRDVTARVKRLAQLIQDDRLASLGTLGAGVAHEINNPLAYLMANLEIAARRLPALAGELRGAGDGAHEGWAARLDEACEMLRIAREGAERIRAVVDDLRRLSRPDGARAVPLDVARVIDASVSLASEEIRRHGRIVVRHGPLPPVVANEARLGQVILNLLVNARDALADRPSERNEIRVTAELDGDRVVIAIADNGVGIPPAELHRVFDPFFTTKPTGTGLGLAICHGIVRGLGGTIDVVSEPGQGTTVRVRLPARLDLAPPGVGG